MMQSFWRPTPKSELDSDQLGFWGAWLVYPQYVPIHPTFIGSPSDNLPNNKFRIDQHNALTNTYAMLDKNIAPANTFTEPAGSRRTLVPGRLRKPGSFPLVFDRFRNIVSDSNGQYHQHYSDSVANSNYAPFPRHNGRINIAGGDGHAAATGPLEYAGNDISAVLSFSFGTNVV